MTSTSSVRLAAMHEHLVDHDLEEQRRDQRKQLEEEGSDQDFRQEMPVLPDRAQKPCEIEAPGEIREGPPVS